MILRQRNTIITSKQINYTLKTLKKNKKLIPTNIASAVSMHDVCQARRTSSGKKCKLHTHTHRSEGYIAKKSIAKRRQDNEEPACNARVSVEFLSLRVLFCRPGFGKTKGVGGVSVKTVSLYTSLLNNQRQSSLSFESIINGVCELHLLIHVLITFVAKKETYNARRFSHRKKEGSK